MTECRNVLITGASGMIGTALTAHLEAAGYSVYALSRRDSAAPFFYDEAAGQLQLSTEIPLLGVVNLAGANISDKRWSVARKQEILESRTLTTRRLCEELARLPEKPSVLLSASAIGYYGDTGTNVVDEHSPAGSGFLAKISIDWEQATAAAQSSGIRTLLMRFGLVLSPSGGVLDNFVMPMGLAVAGRIGSGEQYMSWIALDDVLRIVERGLTDTTFNGTLNLVTNHPVSNAEFSATLARVLHRPKLFPTPAPLMRLAFGEMADAALLSSARVHSHRMQELGIELAHPKLEGALTDLYRRT